MDKDDERRQLEHARRALLTEFAGTRDPQLVERSFSTIVRQFDDAPIRSFVPVLVRRAVRQQLREVAR